MSREARQESLLPWKSEGPLEVAATHRVASLAAGGNLLLGPHPTRPRYTLGASGPSLPAAASGLRGDPAITTTSCSRKTCPGAHSRSQREPVSGRGRWASRRLTRPASRHKGRSAREGSPPPFPARLRRGPGHAPPNARRAAGAPAWSAAERSGRPPTPPHSPSPLAAQAAVRPKGFIELSPNRGPGTSRSTPAAHLNEPR